MNSDEEESYQRQGSLFDVENVSDGDRTESEHMWDSSKICVELGKGGDGFGITLDGGIDRPLYERDKGIFIIGIRGGSNAEKLGSLQAGDKILEVNGKSLHNLTHESVVELFKNSKDKVKLVIHKNIGQILGPPTNSTSYIPNGLDTTSDARELKGFSPFGFVMGVAIGCVVVFAIRRYLTQR